MCPITGVLKLRVAIRPGDFKDAFRSVAKTQGCQSRFLPETSRYDSFIIKQYRHAAVVYAHNASVQTMVQDHPKRI